MANYGLYTDIDSAKLRSAARSILSQLSPNKTELGNLKKDLNDEAIWKAGAKTTLITAFSKIESEVYTEIENKLNNIIKIAEQIKIYKANEEAANTIKGSLDSAKGIASTPQTSISQLEKAIAKCEANMDSAERNIKGLCG